MLCGLFKIVNDADDDEKKGDSFNGVPRSENNDTVGDIERQTVTKK